MIVRCIRKSPNDRDLEILGPDYFRGQSFGIKSDREYVVLGMFTCPSHPLFGRTPWIQFKNDDGRFGQAPLLLFEILDPHLSKYWTVHQFDNGVVSVGPPSFNAEYYMDDYYEGIESVVADFDRVSHLIEAEARASLSQP
jgi:hypothetical protein